MGFSLKSVRFIFAVNNLFTISFCTFSHWINGYFSRFFGCFKPFLGFSRLFYILYSACQITFVWAVSDGFLLSQVKNVGAVSFVQIDLFLHMFFAPENAISKYNNVLTRTYLFSLKLNNSRTAHRIELCK